MIGTIEIKMEDVLKSVDSARGYAFRTLTNYPTDWDAYFAEVTPTFPAAWVVFGGARRLSVNATSVLYQATYGLVVAAQNVRNEKAQRHGQVVANGKNDIGSYQLLEDAIRLLGGNTLGLDDISALEPGDITFVRPFAALLKAKASMLAVQFTTKFSIDFGGFIAPLDDLDTIDASWDVPPFRDPPTEDLRTTLTDLQEA
jgi:phage gp37-like protein